MCWQTAVTLASLALAGACVAVVSARRPGRVESEIMTTLGRVEAQMGTLAEKIQQVEDALMAERKDHAAVVESLKAQLKAAWESDHEEDYQNSLKEMDELIEKLKQPAPAFQPSAN